MRLFLALLALLTLSLWDSQAYAKRSRGRSDKNSQRKGRIFSIFSVVKFKNEECTTVSDDTLTGTCLSATDCQDQGGQEDGNCAAGFGVCCTYFITDSGDTITKNGTFIENPGFPSASDLTGTHRFTFDRISDDVCQIRLDFINLVTAAPPTVGPDTVGRCGADNTDTVTITSPSGLNPPVLCGTLTGQHIYFETDSSGSAGTLEFAIGSATAVRSFRIKATYIECFSKSKAPAGCTQYFTGASGTFQSFNFAGGQILDQLQYNTCIRKEEGFCRISYKQSVEGSGIADSFNLYGVTPDQTTANEAEVNSCPQTFIQIPSVSGAGDTFCGDLLAPVDGATSSGVLFSPSIPFVVSTVTLNNLGANAPGTDSIAGYSLDYTQIPC